MYQEVYGVDGLLTDLVFFLYPLQIRSLRKNHKLQTEDILV